ncbi:class I adenylate-forming enzyme family protein [Oceanobacillus jeddahense]|uniref:Acyl--CoA ligase n=1 Tax=Oceanobacillus jeddahense TaxID=1462527 RepID=A0ABY5K0X0_9BACI|nr:class I adenylate-forming enzyme family protein [Oceanobacillus jeddahense]UUI04762.1 acyl--CoA ligase [Oceanobacillus jeddahense]
MDNYNFAQIIHRSADRAPSKTALITNEKTLTYLQLKERVNQAGNFFKSLNIQAGDRVAVMFPNDHRFLEINFGLMAIGAIPVPMNINLGADTLGYILNDSGSKLLIYHHSLESKARLLHEENDLNHYIIAGENVEGTVSNLYYDKEIKAQSTTLTIYHAGSDELCYLPYTSGSTGNPKGCKLTHKGQYWNVQSTAEVRNQTSEDRSLVAVPLFHKNAMAEIKRTFYLGASTVVLPKVDIVAMLQSIQKHQCTFMTGVPAVYRSIVNHLRDSSTTYDLSSLRFVLCGSSDVPKELLDEIHKRMGTEVYEGYGLTEGGPIVLASRKGFSKLGSAGLPVPGCSIKIMSEEEKPLPAGEIGELWVNNPGIADGYWNLPEVSKKRFTADGWLKTGDSAYQDEDGFVYIVGRKDDMINIGGENAYPKEIENILLKHEKIKDVCVLAISHEQKGQVPVAFVVPSTALEEEEVKSFFIDNGPAYAHPRHVFFLDELPLTGPGKINRTELKNKLKALFAERKIEK